MDMISYWKNAKEIYGNGQFRVIIGEYNHKNFNKNGGELCVGLYWKDEEENSSFPNSRGRTSPMVIDQVFALGFLQMVLFQAAKDGSNLNEITLAIQRFSAMK